MTRGFGHDPVADTLVRTVEWYTPPSIFEALDLEFDLDPCSPMTGPVPWIPARRFINAEQDGLRQPWAGSVWLNPPYMRASIGQWTRRLAEHGDGIALVFARTDALWFQECASKATSVCLIRGRVSFVRCDGLVKSNAGAPSALIAFGDTCAEAVASSGLGLIVTPEGSPS